MTVFSKIGGFFNSSMWILEDLIPPFGFTTFASAVVVCVISFYVFKKLSSDGNVAVRDYSKTHSWTPIKITSKAWYCSVCETFLIHGIGVYCDCCGVCADNECVKKANQTLRCKSVSSNNEVHLHHWVNGKLKRHNTI